MIPNQSVSAVMPVSASKQWFTVAKFAVWLALFDFAAIFLDFIFMWPYQGPSNPNYPLAALVLALGIGIIYLAYKGVRSGLQSNSMVAKGLTLVAFAVLFLAFLSPCLPIVLRLLRTIFTRS